MMFICETVLKLKFLILFVHSQVSVGIRFFADLMFAQKISSFETLFAVSSKKRVPAETLYIILILAITVCKQ
jgi:hypothetical protein